MDGRGGSVLDSFLPSGTLNVFSSKKSVSVLGKVRYCLLSSLSS